MHVSGKTGFSTRFPGSPALRADRRHSGGGPPAGVRSQTVGTGGRPAQSVRGVRRPAAAGSSGTMPRAYAGESGPSVKSPCSGSSKRGSATIDPSSCPSACRGEIPVAGKHDGPAGVPVAVGLRDEARRPVTLHERPVGRPPHDVPCEPEAHVRLDPAPLELPVSGQCEHVVLDRVVAAVVLVKAARRRAVDEIPPHHDLARALVGVEAPAAVVVAGDVVDVAVLHGAVVGVADPDADARRVDPAAVGDRSPRRAAPAESVAGRRRRAGRTATPRPSRRGGAPSSAAGHPRRRRSSRARSARR